MIRSVLAFLPLLLMVSAALSSERVRNNGVFDRLRPGTMPAANDVTARNRPRPFCHDSKNGKCLIYWENAEQPDEQLVVVNPQGTVRFAKPKVGSVVAMYGRLYRFTDDGDFVKLDPEREKLDLTIEPDSVAIPIQLTGTERFSSIVRKYAVARLYASLSSGNSTDDPKVEIRARLPGADHTHTLKLGDSFTVAETKFHVRKIVPRDEERSILGWVEVQREPLFGASAK